MTTLSKEVANILSSGKVNLPTEGMSRLEKLASTILERLKQEEIDKLKISTNQASQDLTLKVEKQIQKEVDRHNSNADIDQPTLDRQFNHFRNYFAVDEGTIVDYFHQGEVPAENVALTGAGADDDGCCCTLF